MSDSVQEAQREENRSTANVSELRATFRDIAPLKPRLLFALGDIVNGYADDQGQTLRSQLDEWTKLVSVSAETSLVPVPGNHELNRKRKKLRQANAPTDAVWTDWLQRNRFDGYAGNGPTPAEVGVQSGPGARERPRK